jgi:hypothetical protein
MIRHLSISIFCFFCSAWLWSQGSHISKKMGRVGSDHAVTFDDRYQGVKGTPYIFSEWQKGLIFPSNLDTIHFEFLNFDRQSLELCYKESADSKPLLLNKYIIHSFQVLYKSDSLDFVRVKLPEASDYVFIELVYTGNGELLLDYGKEFIKANYEQSYSVDRRYDEFKDKPTYYLQFEQEGEMHAIKTNKKQTSSLFGSYSQQMLQYLKTEKNSLKSRSEMISMMKYYDSIRK